MNKLTEFFQDPQGLIDVVTAVGLKLGAALAIFIIGKWGAGIAVNLVKNALKRGRLDDTLVGFLGNLLYGLLIAIILVSALGQLGVDTTSAAALIGGAALAIGLSLQNQLSSFAAGVMLIMFRPFERGHFIEAGGQSGTVEEIRIFATVMKTGDNKQVTIPNNSIWNNSIVNYTVRGTRRIDLIIGVSYDADLKQTREVIEGVLSREGRLLDEPAAIIGVDALADSSVNFVVRPWVKTSDYWPVRWALTENIKIALDEAGIGIPYPQMDLHFPEGGCKTA